MTLADRWARQPQQLWLRKALFQVHLWTGIIIGLYVVAICVSGSALVFRDRIFKSLQPKPRLVAASGRRLTPPQLRAAAQRAHPGYTTGYVFQAKNRNQAVVIWLDRKGSYIQRLFDPYTGQDLGPSEPLALRSLTWLADLHINLLAGERGRDANGYAAILFTLLSLTGAVMWWPGAANWRRSLTAGTRSNWKRFNWELHSMIGFWTFAFFFMWGITGIYVVFPAPFQRVVALFVTPDLLDPRRSPDEQFLRWFTRLHFGSFDWPWKFVWVVLGLAPVALFITGVLMWWNRVLHPRIRALGRKAELARAAAPSR
ncbi:MAG TPA: PepSY-associated TM helix domain-containing protein [Bryobacteraceae bacterium]|nr:PepSY-associated TM helix domain-containing protein [Bryobacteraceae bacterium]